MPYVQTYDYPTTVLLRIKARLKQNQASALGPAWHKTKDSLSIRDQPILSGGLLIEIFQLLPGQARQQVGQCTFDARYAQYSRFTDVVFRHS